MNADVAQSIIRIETLIRQEEFRRARPLTMRLAFVTAYGAQLALACNRTEFTIVSQIGHHQYRNCNPSDYSLSLR